MKRMRKGMQFVLAAMLVAVMVVGLASAGCGGGTAGEKTVVLKYSQVLPIIPGYFGSPASESSVYYWKKAVETVTEGRVQIEIYPSELLNKQEMAYDAVKAGIVDIAWSVATYSRDWMPLETVFFMGLDMESCEMNYQVHNRVYGDYLYPEYKKLGLVAVTVLGREQLIIYSARKPINTIEDFRGMTFMSGGREMENLISKLGALSVSVEYQDAYDAMQKGIMEAAMLDITAPFLFSWYDVGDPGYIIDCGGIGNAKAVYIAKEDLLNRLRPEDAYALMKLTDYWLGISGSQGSDRSNQLYWDEIPKVGMVHIEWSEAEKERLREMKRDTYQWWVGWMDSAYGMGAEAEALLEAILQAMDDYEPGNIVPANPATYAEEWMRDKLRDAGWIVDEEAWQAVVGPHGHWGMDYVYREDVEPWYEKWWREQNMEHPWYEDWKREHQ